MRKSNPSACRFIEILARSIPFLPDPTFVPLFPRRRWRLLWNQPTTSIRRRQHQHRHRLSQGGSPWVIHDVSHGDNYHRLRGSERQSVCFCINTSSLGIFLKTTERAGALVYATFRCLFVASVFSGAIERRVFRRHATIILPTSVISSSTVV